MTTMTKKTQNQPKDFNFEDSAVSRIAEEIREGDKTATVTAAPAYAPDPAEERRKHGSMKKPDVGITIQLPRRYYKLLRDIKDETGTPLRDLALKAVTLYLDAYKAKP